MKSLQSNSAEDVHRRTYSASQSPQALSVRSTARSHVGFRGVLPRMREFFGFLSLFAAKIKPSKAACLHERSDMQPPNPGHTQHSPIRSGSDGEPSAPSRTENEAVQEVLQSDWPVVSVRWVDAEARGGPGWEDPEDMIEFAPRPLVEVHTVGLLLHSCERHIALTDSRGPDQIGGVQKIPRAWINTMDIMVPSDEHLPPSLPLDGARAG